jgi:hypothetical protein
VDGARYAAFALQFTDIPDIDEDDVVALGEACGLGRRYGFDFRILAASRSALYPRFMGPLGISPGSVP